MVVSTTNTATITFYGDPRSAPAGTPVANLGPNGGLKLGTPPAKVIQFIPYVVASGTGTGALIANGMYDRHESKPVNLVQINMAALNTALTDMAGSTTTAGTDVLLADNLTKWGRGPTGGYDTYTRTIARHLGKHIPGNPSFVVENMTGAGSLIAANYTYKIAKPDGLTIGHFIGGLMLQQVMGIFYITSFILWESLPLCSLHFT